MLKHNCYRPFDPQTVVQLKRAGFLPGIVPHDKPLVLTLQQGVEYGKTVLPAWKKQREEEITASKK